MKATKRSAKQPVIEVLWRNGHLVQVQHRGEVVWERKAGTSKTLLRRYLDKAAAFRNRLLAQA